MSDKDPRGQKRQQVSASGAIQPASKEQGQVHYAAPEDPQDRRATPEGSTSGATQPVHFAPTQESGSSTSGAAQSVAPLPQDPEEKRVAKNKVVYTKAAFLGFYESREYAEKEWAAAPLVGRAGPMNALTGRAMPDAERIVQEIYDWYEDRVEDEELHAVLRHLQNTLFKNVTV